MMSEEIEQQKEKVRQMTNWQKFKYFWYYNWVKIVLICVAAIVAISICFTIYQNREEYIYVAMANCNITNASDTNLMSDYTISRAIGTANPATLNVNLAMSEDTLDSLSLANSQSLQAFIEMGDCDVLIADEWIIDDFAHQGYLFDLSKQLPKTIYDQIKDQLYYYKYEDGTRVAAGFYADDIPKIRDSYDATIRPIVALPSSTKSPDIALDFIQYLFE